MSSNSSAVPPLCDNGVRHWGGRSRFSLKHICRAHAFKQHSYPSAWCSVTSEEAQLGSASAGKDLEPFALLNQEDAVSWWSLKDRTRRGHQHPWSGAWGESQPQPSPKGSQPNKVLGLGFLFTWFTCRPATCMITATTQLRSINFSLNVTRM